MSEFEQIVAYVAAILSGSTDCTVLCGDIDIKFTKKINGSLVKFTPAGWFAYNGKIDAAEILRINHGANVHWIAACAALQASNVQYAEQMRTSCGADINFIVQGAAIGLVDAHVDYLYIHGACKDNIMCGYGQGGHYAMKREKFTFWDSANQQEQAKLNESFRLGLKYGGHSV